EGVTDAKSISEACGVILSWSKPAAGPMPDSFIVYRAIWTPTYIGTKIAGLRPGSYIPVDTTTDTLCRIRETVVDNEIYSYCITSLYKGKESIPSIGLYSTPSVPMGLVATLRSGRQIDLKWKKHSAEDIVGFNIYRAMGDTNYREQFVRINSSPITSYRYTDSSVTLTATGDIAQYAVTAINKFGAESGFSPLAYSIPDPVPGLWVDTVSMKLIWNKSLSDSIRFYEVLYALKSDTSYWNYIPGWTSMGLIRDTFISITNLDYAYGLRALNGLAQRGFYSDFVPCADRYKVNLGWYKGDGRFQQPVVDTFWSSLGDGEIVAEHATLHSAAPLTFNASPNPFSNGIVFGIKTNCRMVLSIYSINGRLLFKKVLNGGVLENKIVWDGKDFSRNKLPAGIYLAKLSGSEKMLTKKIHLLR
ncbi:MAG: T9SS type A sorting domain-containing protein, partial [Fibrobacteres bacterium]|nr:T9SS type A sorting domain-containing protein [Fibrobacterota bacterium]